MMETFENKLLMLPKKIDFYNYESCAGGEFWQSMITLSCPKTKIILRNDDFEIREKDNFKFFRSSKYDKTISIHAGFPALLFLTAENIINLYKYQLINHMIYCRPGYTFYKPSPGDELTLVEKYKDVLFVFSNHWRIESEIMKTISEYKYWTFLDLNPEENFSRKLICKMIEMTGIGPRNNYGQISPNFDPYPFLERIPFLDYILFNDYDSIKYFIENRYGSNLDFDFIDQSLRMWKKVRVDPYL